MKKIISIVLAFTLAFTFVFVGTAAEDEKVLKFNDDGTFKILQINDSQDVGEGVNKRTIEFIEAALDKEQPDLVVFVGDQLADSYPFGTKEDMTLAIQNIIEPLKERNIPFLVTLGNHDHDHLDTISKAEQFAVYSSYDNCLNGTDGWDEFTVNAPVYSSDGESIAMSVFMMNTHNKAETGGYSGVVEGQNEWYKNVSAELKAANGGENVPSMLFQHIPPKEIYNLFRECEWHEDGAIFSRRDNKWYKLDENKAQGNLGEAPCSEDFDNITGQYESWLETGNIMGAFFGHDHVNDYVGTTDDGIVMGYNGGTGFSVYGNGGDRSVRVFEFNENDVTNYETRILTYNEVTGENISFVFVDLFSPALLTTLMKIVYFFVGWIIELF